jgi:hypothetical protein
MEFPHPVDVPVAYELAEREIYLVERRLEAFLDGSAGIDEILFFRRCGETIDDIPGILTGIGDDESPDERSEFAERDVVRFIDEGKNEWGEIPVFGWRDRGGSAR